MTHGLRDEIKQVRPFQRRSAEAMLSLFRTAAVLDHEFNEVLKPYGLTLTQYNVLRILRGAGEAGHCGRAVGERLVTPVPDVSRLLERMEGAGFLKRERDPEDRRHVTATITDAGRKLLDQVTPELDLVERARFGKLSESEVQGLISTLEHVRESK